MSESQKPKKCYNTFSCIMSVLVIVFIIGAVLWDLFVTKPVLRESINEIKTEVRIINEKIDAHYNFVDLVDSIATDSIIMAMRNNGIDTLEIVKE